MSTATIEQERFPRDEYCNDAEINGTYYLWYDADYTEEQMFEYIFNDNKIFLNANQPVYTPQYEYSEDSSNTKTSNPSNNKDNLTSPTINDFNEDLKEVPVITIP